ncbi:hypothetical protein AALO_G00123680 [Alosa alosa]|uniref:Ig-like domain-containing protein n=1 Tax=Alosa alosa TaxID=278164 RepID=A0AAV6GMM6_9TELE|nr:amphoterin-induced protein 2 [Alosa alosa]KAG5275709.1 hypothetical protein AALO_G00123680 [Alosa alosa]
MSLTKAVFCTAVLLLLHCVALSTCSSSSTCPLACLCERGPHINCSSLDLRELPQHIPETVTTLNLSHNALRSLPPLWPGRRGLGGLRYLWLDYNKMETLSLCVRKNWVGLKTSARERCVSWAPALEELYAERNQMHQIPKGLGGSANLRVLQLSHNKIPTLGMSDFEGCGHLRGVHLQGNLIRTIHPLAFKDLQELQVLDLRFNLLTTVPSPVYLSLLNLRAQVDLTNNRWRCDCNLRGIRNRMMQTDLDQAFQSWKLVCSSPPRHAGKELIHLRDQDLTCPVHGYGHVDHFDKVAEEGTQILLHCGTNNQDCSQALWWTPQGQATGTQQGLLITDVTERDTGLYVCLSGQQEEHVSVFDLHVLHEEAGTRLKRALEHTNLFSQEESQRNQVRAAKTLGQFNLAICLSVFITFIIAFIIGVLVRPCLDTLWRKVHTKKSSSVTPPSQTIVTAEDSVVYDNEGFAMADEPEEVRVGQRVTFSEVNQPIYDRPVDGGDTSSESSTESEHLYQNNSENSVVVENLETQQQSSSSSRTTQEPLYSEIIKQQGSETSGRKKVVEFEPIPDPDPEELTKDTSSISSASTIPDQDQTYENVQLTTRKTEGGKPQVDNTREQTIKQQNSLSPVVKPVPFPVFNPEPFTDWATQLMEENKEQSNPLDPDLWNDSGRAFPSLMDLNDQAHKKNHTANQLR